MPANRDRRETAIVRHPSLGRLVGGVVIDREAETVIIRWNGMDVTGRALTPEEVREIEAQSEAEAEA